MNPLRIRTITACVPLQGLENLASVERALRFLSVARTRFEQNGYEVQTTRIATSPVLAGADERAREQALARLQTLDRMLVDAKSILSIGPVQPVDARDSALAAWATELVRTTGAISFSAAIASERGVHDSAIVSAAKTIAALGSALPGGVANFRYAAAANIPAGTPFFPVAWCDGADSFAIGMESAGLVQSAFQSAKAGVAADTLRGVLNHHLAPIEQLAGAIAADTQRAYLGVDSSPAPGMDRSIGAAIETLTGAPFGASGTLETCSVVTAALKSLDVRTCGYSGLMLPVLEDPVLARRATERRFGVHDLLLYSSVCGTGLDVAPIAGDTPVDVIARLLRDVAALSMRLRKPLSARLFPIPGKKAGDMVSFNDPLLTDCAVMHLD